MSEVEVIESPIEQRMGDLDQSLFMPREISWLSFNARVLQEAMDPEVPAIQRLRYLGIFSNNLDEFFRVRVAEVRRLISITEADGRQQYRLLLEDIQANLFNQAKARTEASTHTIDAYDDYKQRIKGGGFFRVFLDHKNPEVEQRLQDDTKSTIRCIPFDAEREEGECMITGAACHYRVIAAQSY